MNLLDLVEQDVKVSRVGAGREYAGPCPLCGGEDRFRVWPDTGRYWCRGCGAMGDVIQYLRDVRGMSYREACRVVGREVEAPGRLRERTREQESLKSLIEAVEAWRWEWISKLIQQIGEHEETIDLAGVMIRAGPRLGVTDAGETALWTEIFHDGINGQAQDEDELRMLMHGTPEEILGAWRQHESLKQH